MVLRFLRYRDPITDTLAGSRDPRNRTGVTITSLIDHSSCLLHLYLVTYLAGNSMAEPEAVIHC